MDSYNDFINRKQGTNPLNNFRAKQSQQILSFLMVSLFLIGCSSDDDDDDYVAIVENLTVINAIPDSPVLTITLNVTDGSDGDVDENVAVLDFQRAASFDLDILDVSMEVTYIDQDSGLATVLIGEVPIDMSQDTLHAVVLSGTFQNPDFLQLNRAEGDLADSEDEAELQLINLSNIEPATFELLGATDQSLASRSVSSGLTSDVFRISSDQLYEMSVRDVSAEIVEAGTLTLFTGNRANLILTENPGGDHPLLFLATNSGAVTEFKNLLEPPRLRVLNAVYDRESLNISISDSFTNVVQNQFELDFAATGDYFATSLESVFLDVSYLDGGESVTNIVSLDEDSAYTLVVAGTAATPSSVLAESDDRSIATMSQVMLLNAANIVVNAGSDDEDTLHLDFYLLQDGESLEDVSPQASGLDFLDVASVKLPAQPTILVATESGTNLILAGPVPVEIADASRVVVAAVETVGGGLPLGLSVSN